MMIFGRMLNIELINGRDCVGTIQQLRGLHNDNRTI